MVDLAIERSESNKQIMEKCTMRIDDVYYDCAVDTNFANAGADFYTPEFGGFTPDFGGSGFGIE